LTKQIRKMINRIEKILVPVTSMTLNEIGPRFEALMKKIHDGIYYHDPNNLTHVNLRRKQSVTVVSEPTLEMIFSNRIVDWKVLEYDIITAIMNNDKEFIIPEKIKQEIEVEKKLQCDTLNKLRSKGKLQALEVSLNLHL